MNPDSKERNIFQRVKPSYLVLLALVPLVVYLFVTTESYQRALDFILPGLYYTILVAILGYIAASVLGLGLAGMMLLPYGRNVLRGFLITTAVAAAASVVFWFLPQSQNVLLGANDEGRVAILSGTPDRLVTVIEDGAFAEGAVERSFRSVTTVEDAFDRLERGIVTAVFIPAEAVADAPVRLPELWRVDFRTDGTRNPAIFLGGLAFLLVLLAFAGAQHQEHPFAIFAELYVDLIRGVPMLVVILFIGFVIPPAIRDATGGRINITSDLVRGIMAIALGYAAYMAEIFRAGIEAIPKGQFEASRSLGLNGWQTARYIVLPQAIAIVLPPLGNEFIAMLKDTALLSVIGIGDVTRKAREFGASNFDLFPPYNTAAIIYVVLTLTASSLLKELERRSKRSTR